MTGDKAGKVNMEKQEMMMAAEGKISYLEIAG